MSCAPTEVDIKLYKKLGGGTQAHSRGIMEGKRKGGIINVVKGWDEGISGGTRLHMAGRQQEREQKRVYGWSPVLEKKGRREGM